MECYPYAAWGCAPHAHYHPNYQNYYRYEYPTHPHHEHMHNMEYGAYAAKEARVRRALSRRDARHSPAQPLPLAHTPPLDHGMNRGAAYCEPQMWSHYHQMGMGNSPWAGGMGLSGMGGMGTGWQGRSCFREYMRYPQLKNPYPHTQSSAYSSDGRCTPYNVYESSYTAESSVRASALEYPAPAQGPGPRIARERLSQPPPPAPPEPKRPPVVPLPAFQQAFGSTEIGKFAEAFSRTEAALDDAGENFAFESFPDWETPTDPQWTQPTVREIKCEDTY